ncbi:conserved hypothetical protein [Gammaproteobacteria bacterium]
MIREIYENDFYAWTENQVTLLRGGQLAGLDLEHIAEELESMGRSERRELESRLEVLVMHLLKWRYQPQRRGTSWYHTIVVQRARVLRVLEDNPSLRPRTKGLLDVVYPTARLLAAGETGIEHLPEVCPFTLNQVLDTHYWPESI